MSRLSNFIEAALREGRSPAEIAEELNCSEEDVRRHLPDVEFLPANDLAISSTGEILTPGSLARLGARDFVDPVGGTTKLGEELRVTAGCLLREMQNRMRSDIVSTKELSMMSSAVSTMQSAFFSRPTTAIINAGGANDSRLLSDLRKRLKS